MNHDKSIAFTKGNNYIIRTENEKKDIDGINKFAATKNKDDHGHIVLQAKLDEKGVIIGYAEDNEWNGWFNEHFTIIEKYTKATERYICECGFDLRDKGMYYNVDSTLEFNEETCKFEISSQAPELTCSNCDRYTSLTKEDLALC